MSEKHPNPESESDAERTDESADEFAQYAAFDTEGGSVVIYDETNNRAWIQSDTAVTLDAKA